MLLSISELTQKSYRAYLATLRHFAPFLLVLAGVFFIQYISGLIGVYLDGYSTLSAIVVDSILLLILLGVAFISFWTTLAILKTAHDIYKNLPLTNLKLTYVATAKYIIPTALISILVSIIIFFGSILFLIPGLIFLVWYYFANYAIIFEDQKGLVTLKTSKNLIVGRWFQMAFRMLIPKIVFGIFVGILLWLFSFLMNIIFGAGTVQELVKEIFSSLISILTMTLFIWTDVILYFNAKENPVVILTPPIV